MRRAALLLLQRYVTACDAADAAAISSLFLDDGAVVSNGEESVGAKAVLSFYASRLRPGGLHLSAPSVLEPLDDTTVRACTTFLALRGTDDGSVGLPGTWDDEIDVTDGVGRFRRRAITTGRAVPLVDLGVDILEQLAARMAASRPARSGYSGML
jgi:hypothetical protein